MSDTSKPPIVCFSHVDWNDEINQRPRQILTRLATAGHPVYYFECAGANRQHPARKIAAAVGGGHINVYTVLYKPDSGRWAGVRRWAAGLKIARILNRQRVKNPILWFYHPLLFALGYSYADSAIVYDVTENFTSEDQSQDDLYFEELTVLAEADVVFADGQDLETHVQSMMADLVAGGTRKAPRADVHRVSAPAAAPEWDKAAAAMEAVLNRIVKI